MTIKWLGAHSNNFQVGRNGKKIDKVVLHWIVGTLESADATFQKRDRIASSHYGIGDDEIHQYVKEEDTAYHAGNWLVNQTSIGIEHEGGWLLPDGTTRFKPTQKTHETSANLVKEICTRYGIPIDRTHIRKHSEVSDKPTACPGALDIDLIISLAKNSIIDDTVITYQTRIPQIDNLEVQAIRSLLNDRKRDLENLQNTLNTLTTKLDEQTKETKRISDELLEAKKGLLAISEDRERLTKEVQQIRSELGEKDQMIYQLELELDKEKEMVSLLKKDLEACQNISSGPTVNFTNPLAKFLYEWAKRLG